MFTGFKPIYTREEADSIEYEIVGQPAVIRPSWLIAFLDSLFTVFDPDSYYARGDPTVISYIMGNPEATAGIIERAGTLRPYVVVTPIRVLGYRRTE